jgi:hypothetical protein
MPSTTAKRAATEALRRQARASLLKDRAPPPGPGPSGTEAPSVTPSSPPPSTPVSSSPILEANPSVPESAPNPSARPVQNPDGSWAFRGETYARGHDAWASFPPDGRATQPVRPWREWLSVQHTDGRPWGTTKQEHRKHPTVAQWAKLKDWRSWPTVTTCDGTPWGSEEASTRAQHQKILHDLCTPSRPWKEWLVVLRTDGSCWGEPARAGYAGIGRWMGKITVELAGVSGMTADEPAMLVEMNWELIAERFSNGTARSDVVKELHELMESARMILAAE